ncbi:hypothetical protein [Clostridium thermopalmarium]|uniref:Uncharacterized protein n=1 Tax=Clostridium thermopalmarium DSM 5974 TaxID=1121340 RepID=A0A2T0AQD7_9CLOT|nr:hypothetical protein [Clostridium thermopalmarium]PRR71324.1 hypothetical protein CPAL_17540 [Clostridium thermopalmarium DSM 5974]PVZ15780.1 hypothetical protein LX19_02835 [Clostridium thermopalmarium DSM 5974]
MIDKDTLKKYMSDLQQCINSTVEYIDMKKELSRFLYDDFYKGNTFLYSMQMYKRIVGWFYIINYMKNYKISDLNWNVICELHNSNFNDKLSEAIRYYKRKEIGVSIKRLFKYYEKKKLMVGHLDFYDILNKFYLLLCNNVRYKSMKNIKEVNEYKHLLLNYSNYESLTIETDNEYLNLERNRINPFVLDKT